MTLDRIAWFIGEVARPVAIIMGCFSAAAASIIMASKVTDGNDGYLLAGAIWLGASVLFGAKAAEEFGKSKNSANVQIARSTGNAPTPQEVVVTNTHADPVHVEETRP
jgi:hypothetical protein